MENLEINSSDSSGISKPEGLEIIHCSMCQDVGICGQCQRGIEENRKLQERKKKTGKISKWWK